MAERSLIERAASAFEDEDVLEADDRDAPKSQVADEVAEASRLGLGDEDVDALAPTPDETDARFDDSGEIVRFDIDFEEMQARGFLTPFSLDGPLAEEFRLLKRPLLKSAFVGNDDNRNIIMVTSAKPREGKTFVSTNLAISIACEKDVHVLLVEADAMRPSIMKSFGLPESRPGLMDLLQNPSMDPADVIVRTNIGKLSIIPAGGNVDLGPELLASEQMSKLTDEFASRYRDRIIIFDTPPLLAATEPSALAQHAGQVLFVVESGRTSSIAAKSALDLIKDHKNVVMMLNKVQPLFDLAHFGRSGYGYYYGYGKKRTNNWRSMIPWLKGKANEGGG